MKQGPAKQYDTVPFECLRQRQLSATDWIVELVPPTVDLLPWVAYRRQLEALPQLAGWPVNLDWPTPPGGNPSLGDPPTVQSGALQPHLMPSEAGQIGSPCRSTQRSSDGVPRANIS
jgi:hypothetical protein